jgi:hypothetical protein
MAPNTDRIAPPDLDESIVEDGKTIHSKNVDEALRFLEQNVTSGDLPEIDDKKLMRRVDWMIMPLMFACYYLQYSDKTLSNSGNTIKHAIADLGCSVICEYHGHHRGHQYASQRLFPPGNCVLCRISDMRADPSHYDPEVPNGKIFGYQW